MVSTGQRRLLPSRRARERHGGRRLCRGFAHIQGAHAVVQVVLSPYVKRAGVHLPRYFVAPRLLAHAIGPCRVAVERHGSCRCFLLLFVHKLVTLFPLSPSLLLRRPAASRPCLLVPSARWPANTGFLFSALARAGWRCAAAAAFGRFSCLAALSKIRRV